MKILHVPFIYYPDPCGGTEVYVDALCHFLAETGIENVVAAPAPGPAHYEHNGVRVHRFPTHSHPTQDMMYGEGDPVAAAGFALVLEQEKPDLVHFHALTSAVSVRCLREAQKRGIPAIATYHTATHSCLRATLMRWDVQPCDGEIQITRCAACFLHSHGMPRALANIAARASRVSQPLAHLPGLPNAARAVLRSAAMVAGYRAATLEWWSGMKRVIALCDWTQRLLLLNGVPAERVSKVRHGLPWPVQEATREAPASLPLKLAFLGRLDHNKGIDLIVNALRLVPDLPVALDLFTVRSTGTNPVEAELLKLAKGDPRITFQAPIPSAQVVDTLRGYHALLVPSRVLETGPLVVIEAFAAGIPVVGSDLGGISEWVDHERNGLLVPGQDTGAWRDALLRIALEPGLLPSLRAGVEPPRSMRDVAAEMREIYLQELAADIR